MITVAARLQLLWTKDDSEPVQVLPEDVVAVRDFWDMRKSMRLLIRAGFHQTHSESDEAFPDQPSALQGF